MREFACGDVIPGCGAVFRAGSDTELEALATAHARHSHGLVEVRMPADITARVRAAMHPVPAA